MKLCGVRVGCAGGCVGGRQAGMRRGGVGGPEGLAPLEQKD